MAEDYQNLYSDNLSYTDTSDPWNVKVYEPNPYIPNQSYLSETRHLEQSPYTGNVFTRSISYGLPSSGTSSFFYPSTEGGGSYSPSSVARSTLSSGYMSPVVGYPSGSRLTSAVRTTGYSTPRTFSGSLSVPSMPTVAPLSLPSYSAPKRDEGRVSELQQLIGGAEASRLADMLRETVARVGSEENPYVKKQLLRQALRGYGEGLDTVMSGAGKQARAEYAQEYATNVDEAKSNWQSQVQQAQANWTAERDKVQKQWEAQVAASQAKFEAALRSFLAG